MTLAPELHALDFLILFWKIPRYISSSCDKRMMCPSSCSGKNDFGRVISHFWMVRLAQVSHFRVEDTKSQSKYSVDPIQDNTFLLAVSNQSILKEINPEYSLEGLLLKLKLQYFGHLLQRDDSLKKTLDAGKDWGQEEKGVTEDEMVGWHHRLSRYEFEQALGDGEGQGSLACYSSWDHQETDTIEWLNNNKVI